ncbi:cupredoxin domain-containing protein [Pseudomonas citrulli]|uniref:Cupredoxin domain-containing protein n=1 Tax=Pseudomonas citrulli TaxID=3064347 RepID=A0ABT9C4S5_9PSED|nr:cupredoxin domain-containing protein [Pseudomonas sp. K18]MDO7899805.1 cupredoxin domain-containing protein [Pseudomonas sp. K18]
MRPPSRPRHGAAHRRLAGLTLAGLLLPAIAQAELPTYALSIRDGLFIPPQLEVPAGQRFKIVLKNIGQGPAEFESTPLRVEKVLSPGVTTFVVIHPLRPGHYPFFDEFNPQLPEGGILAR